MKLLSDLILIYTSCKGGTKCSGIEKRVQGYKWNCVRIVRVYFHLDLFSVMFVFKWAHLYEITINAN